VFLVSGEAGLGKTTLVAATARTAFDGGACVLFGHCEEDLATPYQLFAEALGHFVIHASEAQLVAHVDAHGSAWPDSPGAFPQTAGPSAVDAPMLTASGTSCSPRGGVVAGRSVSRSWSCRRPAVGRQGEPAAARTVTADLPMRVLVLGTYRIASCHAFHPPLDTSVHPASTAQCRTSS
jgi:hypothetical protein